MKTKSYATLSLLLAIALPSCSARYDMVTFDAAGLMPSGKKNVPNIAIDTNTSAGMFGGAIQSKKPYDIHAFYTDSTLTIASAEFTKVTVTYADGTVDPGIAALKLPLHTQHRYSEDTVFVTGGTTAVIKQRRIEAEFPATVTRDEPFTLIIEGKFTKDNGTVIPFTIKEKYKYSRDNTKQSWVEFVSSC